MLLVLLPSHINATNIMQRVKTLRTILFNYIEFILVKKKYIITNNAVLNLTIPKKKKKNLNFISQCSYVFEFN